MRQGVGMPPKRWLTMARFNRVYAELVNPCNTRSVTDTMEAALAPGSNSFITW